MENNLKRAVDKLSNSKEGIQKRKKQDIPISLILQRVEDLGRLFMRNPNEDEVKKYVLKLVESTLQKERIYSFSAIENDDPFKGMIIEYVGIQFFNEEYIMANYSKKSDFFHEHLSRIKTHININTEHGNRIIIDAFLLEVVHEKENYIIFPEYQVSVELENGNILKGPIDYVIGQTLDSEPARRKGIAKPIPDNEVIVVEAKSDSTYESDDSIYQLKAEMLAVHLKKSQKNTRGCLTNGKSWTFVLLHKNKFYLSSIDITWDNDKLLPILKYWFNDFSTEGYERK